jgi:RNA polymerase-binding transcription factor DksA
MATKKNAKPAIKKKAAPAKKTVPAKKAAPVKKPVPAKKAAPVKKAVPAKKAAPVKKAVPAKKAAPVKKAAPAKKAAPVKKAAPAKKVAPAKKAVPAKKVVTPTAKPVAKKAIVPAKPAPKMPTPAPAQKQQPAAKAPAVKAPVAKPVAKPVLKNGPTIKASVKNPKDIKIPAPKPVVLPKINTKTARTYQPDFTKSVLDQKKNDPGAPMVKYSDNDLMEFKELILRKLESAKKELSFLQGLITRKDEAGGDESENRYMTMEDGSLSMEREQLSQMASRQITFIDHLEKALMRIENKTYGVCRVTGKLIDKARLRAVPHATLSIEAKMGMVK